MNNSYTVLVETSTVDLPYNTEKCISNELLIKHFINKLNHFGKP